MNLEKWDEFCTRILKTTSEITAIHIEPTKENKRLIRNYLVKGSMRELGPYKDMGAKVYAAAHLVANNMNINLEELRKR